MNLDPISAVANTVTTIVDRFVPDKGKAAELAGELNRSILELVGKQLEASSAVIVAEAQGKSWLQRNWRPIIMVLLATLVGCHWLGFTPPNLDRDFVLRIMDILEIGVGGYVLTNTVERTARAITGSSIGDRIKGRFGGSK